MKVTQLGATAAFCLAAAVSAAAAVDPAVEWLANNGVFGPGRFTDHSNLDVIPATCVGLALALLLIAGVARRMTVRPGSAPAWYRAAALDERRLPQLLPVIFALQLAVLWSMETIEQFAVAGHGLGGLLWLGGPAAMSLAAHALGTYAISRLLTRCVRWSAQTIVAAVHFIRALCCALDAPRTAPRVRALELAHSRFLEPILAVLNGRAPPHRISA